MKILFFLLFTTTIITGCSRSQQPETLNTISKNQVETVIGTGVHEIQIISDTGESQNFQEAQSDINMNWLISELTKNFNKINISLREIDSSELGYPDTKVLGFYNSGVRIILFDKNHEVYGNIEEFEDAISRYQQEEFYGKNMLYEKLLHPNVLLQFTKSAVMATHGSSKKEYFFSLPNNEILKVKVSFPSDQEIDSILEREVIQNKVNEIEELLLRNLVLIG